MAWSSGGHRLISAAAFDSLDLVDLRWSPADKAAFVSASVQPDLMRPRELPELRAIEAPRHFLNLEVLAGQTLPEHRWQFIRLLSRIAETGQGSLRPGSDVTQAGTLPYAIVEGTQRLAAVFAQLRHRPDDPDLRTMAAHQAGFAAHYAQDLCQPLHTTVHHDGRARADGSSPRTGIHQQVDALMQSISLNGSEIANRRPVVLEPLFPAIRTALEESHSQVDRVYDLAHHLADLHDDTVAAPELIEFASDRYQRAVGLTADLIFTAWHLSAAIDLPDWPRDAAGSALPQR